MNAYLEMGLGWLAVTCFGLGIFLGIVTLGNNEPADSPRLGSRGLQRQIVLANGGSFATFEPLIRLLSTWFAYFPMVETRRKVDEMMKHAGDWLGMTANEFFALSLISAVAMGFAGALISKVGNFTPLLVPLFLGIGAMMPYFQASGLRDERWKIINRTLPSAIDIAALCMGAGLDFPGALRQYVDKSGDRSDPLVLELERILQELELGRTRRQALENFADRCPTEPVRDFVSAVVQAEERGNPLAEVLRIQAGMLRMRRSVAAEEAASRAALQMMMPMMIIFLLVFVLLMGPMFTRQGSF